VSPVSGTKGQTVPTMSEAAICPLRFPNGKIYVGSRVGDIDN
jgi:hypothetical protein